MNKLSILLTTTALSFVLIFSVQAQKRVSDDSRSIMRTNERVKITVYPNPTAELLTVNSASPLNNPRVMITSMLGNQQEITVDQSSPYQLKIDTSKLSQGIYFVLFEDSKQGIKKGFKIQRL